MPDDRYKTIRDGLVVLHQAASGIEGWGGDQAQEFINVGDYGLALDEISYAYLDSGKAMPADLFQIFERLAVAMDLERDDEYEGVRKLLADARSK